jgi:microcystin degradation protein MlrC
MVHPYNKADTVGWSVHVSSDGDAALANKYAEELADMVWAQREVMPPEMYPAGEVLDRVRDSAWRKLGAVSLVDVDDVVGAGAPGGNTRLLSELVDDDRGLCTYVPLHDPAAVEACWALPEGSSLAIALRGTPGYDQPEVSFDATIVRKMETDFGRTIRLDANHGALHVALTERPPYTCSPKFWDGLGLPLRSATSAS